MIMNQLHLCYSPLPLPLSLIRHYLFMLQTESETKIIEVHKKWQGPQTDFVVINYFPKGKGLPIFYGGNAGNKKYYWNLRREKTFELTSQQTNSFLQLVDTYPDRHTYRYWPGPNSNTFTKYLLDSLNLKYDFPVSAIGKNYLV